METINEFQILETGETIDDLSLDMILGGIVAQSASGGCDYCNTCSGGSANNSSTKSRPTTTAAIN